MMAKTFPFYQRIVNAEPVFYRIASGLSIVVGIIGILAFLGHIFHQERLTDWGISVSSQMRLLTSIALICFSIAIPIALTSKRLRQKHFAVRFICYICVLYPFVYGSYFTIFHLIATRFNLLNVLSYTYRYSEVHLLTAACIALLSFALFAFIKWRNQEAVVIYGTCFPALLVFHISLFTLLSYLSQPPLLFSFTLSFPVTIAILLTAVSLLIGTIPFHGILIPVLSLNSKIAALGVLTVLGGILILLKGLVDISSLHSLQSWEPILLIRYFAVSALNTVILSTIFVITSMRALYNYDTAFFHAQLQKEYTDSEILLRHIGEIIYNNATLSEIFQRVVQILNTTLDCNYFLIASFDGNIEKLKEPIYEYQKPILTREDASIPHLRNILPPLVNEVCQSNHTSIEMHQGDPGLAEAYTEFLRQGEFSYAFATPLLHQSHALGAIVVACSNSPVNFNQNDKRIIKFVAKQLAISMNQHELLNQLKIKEVNFHKILEDNIIGIFFGQRTGHITYANQAFLDMLEYERKDVDDGQLNWKELTPVGQEQLDLQMLQEVTEKGRSLPIQGQYQTKNGQIVDVIRSTISFEGTEEDVTFVVDIRKLKRTEIDLLEKNRELEQFASIASHDLQAPLRKIKAFLDLLEQDASERLNESDKDYIERVQNSASRMQQLIGDLLALARVTRSRQPFELVNMLDVFHEVVQDLAIEIAQQEAHVEIGDMFSVEADETQMYQLLQNLLTNSLKYRQTDKPPYIRVWMQQAAANQVQLILEDNGIGFQQEKADWIFGAFTRLGTEKEQKGTGIGLAICRKIVEHHGGKIWATSTPGKGAKFVVELPIHQALAPVRFPYEKMSSEQSVID